MCKKSNFLRTRHSEAQSAEESLESIVKPNGKIKTKNYDFQYSLVETSILTYKRFDNVLLDVSESEIKKGAFFSHHCHCFYLAEAIIFLFHRPTSR